MNNNALNVFEWISAILVPIFLILILCGNFLPPQNQVDTVFYLTNFTDNTMLIPLADHPKTLIYDIMSNNNECFIGNIPQFSTCAFASRCNGKTSLPKKLLEFILQKPVFPNCTQYSGVLRFVYTPN